LCILADINMAQQLVGVRPRFAHAKGNTLVVHSINGAYVYSMYMR
jgi:hypothetical protein